MNYPEPLEPARLIRRYKRFLADVERADGSALTVHCANPGSMMGLAEPGLEVFLSDSGDPKRKLRHSWELVRTATGALVNVNTGRANAVAEEMIGAGHIPELAGYDGLKREVPYGTNSRIDLLLSDPHRAAAHALAYVEVKSVTLSREAGLAEFPDAVTARGAKHLSELAAVAANGDRAVMLFLVQRADCIRFRPAADIDPVYASALKEAADAGVDCLCYACEPSPQGLFPGEKLDIEVV